MDKATSLSAWHTPPLVKDAKAIGGYPDPLPPIIPALTNRGFTGHEHIDEMGLIHMNGRVYDPQIGRFLSADPYIQSPYNTQSYNRYSYTINNPLKYTVLLETFLAYIGFYFCNDH
ncbi:hypothetical protein BSPWISOXPB_1307 [uncultured Gammaproteobacteria bacterium]|nr:hypothetical protein BSPWISOXPB_1307 [uncultured Gammaproteobacteria bacterium]